MLQAAAELDGERRFLYPDLVLGLLGAAVLGTYTEGHWMLTECAHAIDRIEEVEAPDVSKVRLGVSPEVNALATIIIGVVALGVVLATILQLRRPRSA